MTKLDIINEVSKNTGFTKVETELVFESIIYFPVSSLTGIVMVLTPLSILLPTNVLAIIYQQL